MNKKKSVLIVFSVVILVVMSLFLGCNANRSENSKSDEVIENNIINLNLKNYTEYFAIQEEILSLDKSEYTYQYPSGPAIMTEQHTKAYQTTKISIISLKKDLVFNKVEIVLTIKSDNDERWYGKGGTLKLAYDGTGFLTLTANFDSATTIFNENPNAHYKVTSITGSVGIA